MQHVETIIVGGGPAGSTCAWQLKKLGRDVLVVDKADFPREKLCAGWITGKVMQDLEFSPADYPYSFLELQIRDHIKGLPFALRGLPTIGGNFSIRRFEFDRWLLNRSQAAVELHEVKTIRKEGDLYILDDKYSCHNLVGAGGTLCPVRRLLFPGNRRKFRQVVTLEQEFKYPARANECHLYFGHYGTRGYAWYFPKGDGYVNIGLGGKANHFKSTGVSIHKHFDKFLSDLVQDGKIDANTAKNFKRAGHPYYLNSAHGDIKRDTCYLIGDSAGLATVDLGEGIGPAIESALLTADEINGKATYTKPAISQYSTTGLLQRLAKILVAPKPPGR